jgi:hypothetical protein
MCRSILALLLLSTFSSNVLAADLTKIDRTVAKEPAYKSKPKYALLVFGPGAKTRVWLVQDGDMLYVDRKGNGDLTETGNKVLAEKNPDAGEGEYTFKIGDFRVGGLLHKDMYVYFSKMDHLADLDPDAKAFLAKNPNGRQVGVRVDMELPGWKGNGIGGRVRQHTFYADTNGILQFADKPADAPVIHLGGPWSILLWGNHTLTIDRETDLILGLGTAGVGPGSTAWVDYEGVIPEKIYPTVEIAYPPKEPGGSPVRERYEIKKRC